jgi:hypothetical protein
VARNTFNMSSTQSGQGQAVGIHNTLGIMMLTDLQPQEPPYPPYQQGLGGSPSILPDIPPTAVFLFLYIVFAATHQKILIGNKKRQHKFIFSGTMFGKYSIMSLQGSYKPSIVDKVLGFCAIRIVTMSLRIAWACHPRNIRLAIAAQVFVYVGTIILYMVNWFFTQRVIRAQHPRFGWSTAYRLLFRASIVAMIISLIFLIVGAIQPFFTLSNNTHRIDHALQLTGQTSFAAFCFAPIVLVSLSLIFPRGNVDKFGAGRLRNNITILLIGAAILSAGQIFRAVITWVPATPLRNAQGRPVDTQWYYSKACFYAFNFTTELLVIIFYAIMRVDLRFHVPDHCKKPGDYQRKQHQYKRNSEFKVDVVGDEKKLKRRSEKAGSMRSMRSNETLQENQGSLFDDSQTLANSLRYPSSFLEVDPKSGNWKVKRMSRDTLTNASMSQNSLAITDPEAPPLPSDWPLRTSQMARGEIPVMEHRNIGSKIHIAETPERSSKWERGDAIDKAIRDLEANSATTSTSNSTSPPPAYRSRKSARHSRERNSRQKRDSSKKFHPFVGFNDDNRSEKHSYTSDLPSSADPKLPAQCDYNYGLGDSYPSSSSKKPTYLKYEPTPTPTSESSCYATPSTGNTGSEYDEMEVELAQLSFEYIDDVERGLDKRLEE